MSRRYPGLEVHSQCQINKFLITKKADCQSKQNTYLVAKQLRMYSCSKEDRSVFDTLICFPVEHHTHVFISITKIPALNLSKTHARVQSEHMCYNCVARPPNLQYRFAVSVHNMCVIVYKYNTKTHVMTLIRISTAFAHAAAYQLRRSSACFVEANNHTSNSA